jgi:hypothetical protein
MTMELSLDFAKGWSLGVTGSTRPKKIAAKDCQSLAAVGGKHEKDGLFDVVVYGVAFADGGSDGGEVVVSEDHLGCLLGDFGAFDAHGDANIGLLKRGSVINPITRHGHHLSGGLHGADKSYVARITTAIPVARCHSMWQWKNQKPGLFSFH